MITNPDHHLHSITRNAIDRIATTGSHVRIRASYLMVSLTVAGLTIAILPFRDTVSVFNALFLYLILCFGLALWLGSGPAVLAAVLSFFAFNFFLVSPVHTFRVADSDHAIALVAYLGVAIVTGQLVARVRSRTEVAEREQHRTALLYEMNATLIGNVTLDAILNTIVAELVRMYGAVSCRMLQPEENGTLTVRARYPESESATIDRQREVLARRAMELGMVVGRNRTNRRLVPARPAQPDAGLLAPTESDALYVPIRSATQTFGVLEVNGRPGGGRFGSEDELVLTSFANQAALAVERAHLVDQAARTAALAESDAFKTTLLAALSHDLRTPLAVIKASSSALLDDSVHWEQQARSELLTAIDEEADRLDRLVGNLLDLTRLQGTVLQPNRAWYDSAELIADVWQRVEGQRADHPIAVRVADDLPLIHIDYVQMAQVLINLLENAFKYTPPGTPITMTAVRIGRVIELSIADTGPGIAASDLPHVFDAFYRATSDHRIPGSGIGLAICKGFVEANGGKIHVRSERDAGTTFVITLPVESTGETVSG